MNVLLLSRIQFGFTIGFHFLFPPISIGLAWYLVVLEAIALRNPARPRPDTDARSTPELSGVIGLFSKIFAITFAVGVASGIVMSLQFGTNWAGFSRVVNDIFGTFLVAEVLFAFFIESVFLGIYLFAGKRVPAALRFLSILLVALAATGSGFWILTANSWMQTPAGYVVEEGRLVLENFGRAVFNPSMWVRFFHTIDSALISASFLVAGACAYAVLKGKGGETVKRLLAATVIAGLVFCVAQIYPFGHSQAVEVGKNQPIKLAAIEGAYETRSRAPLLVFGIPTPEPPYVTARIEIPVLLSWLFDFKGDYVIRGLRDFPPELYPPLAPTFASFHLMFYLGILFSALTALSVLLLILKKLFNSRWLLWILVAAIPFPLICIQLGWITTEVGRQPWLVYGLLRTSEAVSGNVSRGELLFSLILFGIVYLGLLAAYCTLVVRAIGRGPVGVPRGEGGK